MTSAVARSPRSVRSSASLASSMAARGGVGEEATAVVRHDHVGVHGFGEAPGRGAGAGAPDETVEPPARAPATVACRRQSWSRPALVPTPRSYGRARVGSEREMG